MNWLHHRQPNSMPNFVSHSILFHVLLVYRAMTGCRSPAANETLPEKVPVLRILHLSTPDLSVAFKQHRPSLNPMFPAHNQLGQFNVVTHSRSGPIMLSYTPAVGGGADNRMPFASSRGRQLWQKSLVRRRQGKACQPPSQLVRVCVLKLCIHPSPP
jgi:hypothetical protein